MTYSPETLKTRNFMDLSKGYGWRNPLVKKE